jgi:hypothetical protein
LTAIGAPGADFDHDDDPATLGLPDRGAVRIWFGALGWAPTCAADPGGCGSPEIRDAEADVVFWGAVDHGRLGVALAPAGDVDGDGNVDLQGFVKSNLGLVSFEVESAADPGISPGIASEAAGFFRYEGSSFLGTSGGLPRSCNDFTWYQALVDVNPITGDPADELSECFSYFGGNQ